MLGNLSKPPVVYTRHRSMALDSVCNTSYKSVSSWNSIACNLCLTQTHFKRNNLNFVDGQVIKNGNKLWFCPQCSKNISPFTNINNYKLSLTVKQFSYHNDLNSTNTCLVLNPPENLTNLFLISLMIFLLIKSKILIISETVSTII